MRLWHEAGHLIRLALLLAIAVVAFLGVRLAVVPRDFGQYGHFRGGALEELRARPVKFAGREACTACHAESVESRQRGKHAGVSCEACHGPLASHADDPSSKPKLPEVQTLCARCHEANPARPSKFPQVKSTEHAGGEACNTCHKPHQPKFGA